MTQTPKTTLTPDTPVSPVGARAIARLNAQLLALAEAGDDVPAAEIERMAKATTLLIRAVEQAEGFLAAHEERERPGARLTPERRRQLLIRIRNAVERGLLPELEDEA